MGALWEHKGTSRGNHTSKVALKILDELTVAVQAYPNIRGRFIKRSSNVDASLLSDFHEEF